MKARLNCPLCSRPAEIIFGCSYQNPALAPFVIPPVLRAMLADKPYEVRRCRECDMHFQTWVMEEPELAIWYSNSTSEESIRKEITRQKLHWFAHMIEEALIVRQVCRRNPPVVLDFGSNWGKWASAALAVGCEVDAVEINEAAAKFCAGRGIKIVTLNQLAIGRYDFINVDQVMEHLSDPLVVAQRLSMSLRAEGLMKLSTPGNLRLPQELAAAATQASGYETVLNPKKLDPLAPLEHVNLFTNRSLKELGRRVGLELYRIPIAKSFGAGQLWNLPRQLNRNLRVPFKRWRARGTYLWMRKANQMEPIVERSL